MRVSSCFLLCLLSASLVSGITILDVPAQATVSENNDEIAQSSIVKGHVKEYYDSEFDSVNVNVNVNELNINTSSPQTNH